MSVSSQRPAGVMIGSELRLALNKTETASLLGVSVDFFDQHIAHDLRAVRRGRRRLYAVREIEEWLAREAEAVCALRPSGDV